MNKMILTAFAALTVSPAFAASYSGTCTTATKDKWMAEAAAQAKITRGRLHCDASSIFARVSISATSAGSVSPIFLSSA